MDMAAAVEIAQKQVKESFLSLTAKNTGTIPLLHGKIMEWCRQLPEGQKQKARANGEVFLAMLEGDLRRAMWMVQESEEGFAYHAADYVKHMESHVKGMKPQDFLGGYYKIDETIKSEKMDSETLLSINEMLKNSKDASYLLSLARSCGIPYLNLRTIANFWSDISPFEASQELRATQQPLDWSNWDSLVDEWKFDFDGRYSEFGLSIKNYKISYQNEKKKGVSFSNQASTGIHYLAGNCEVWQFQVKNERLDELMELLEGRAPIVMPLQLGEAEGTASVTVFDISMSLNGIDLRRPFYNVLKARVFDDPKVDMKEFERDFTLSTGTNPKDAKSLSGRISLWSCCDGTTFRIKTDERIY